MTLFLRWADRGNAKGTRGARLGDDHNGGNYCDRHRDGDGRRRCSCLRIWCIEINHRCMTGKMCLNRAMLLCVMRSDELERIQQQGTSNHHLSNLVRLRWSPVRFSLLRWRELTQYNRSAMTLIAYSKVLQQLSQELTRCDSCRVYSSVAIVFLS